VRDDRPFCGTAPPAAAYFYSPDRRGEHPASHLANFTGFLQADGYAGFEALYDRRSTDQGARANRPITEVACWAHCRRKFFDVWDGKKSAVAKEAIEHIAAFYAIEAKARFAPTDERLKHRADTAPLLASFFIGQVRSSPSCRPSRSWPRRSATLSRDKMRCRDSSPTRGSRSTTTSPRMPCAPSRWGGRITCLQARMQAAIVLPPCTLFCILHTAKLNELNPETYLRDTLDRIASGHPISRVDELMPWQTSASS